MFLTKAARENQNTHFMFNNFFSQKSNQFIGWCAKIWYSQTGCRWQNGTCALCAA